MKTELVIDTRRSPRGPIDPRAADAERLDLEYLLAGVLDATRQLLAVNRAAVYYRDSSGRHICPVSFGLSDRYTSAVCSQLDSAEAMGAAGGSIDDLVTVWGNLEDGMGIGEIDCTPLFAVPLLRQGSDLAGAVVVYDEEHRHYQTGSRNITEEEPGMMDAEHRRLEEMLPLLAQAGALVEASPDLESAASQLARFLVPALADWCLVDIVDPKRVTHALGVAHRDPAVEQLIGTLLDTYPPDQIPGSSAKVLATGQAEFHGEIPDEVLAGATADPAQLRVLQQIGLASLLIVPLRRHGEVLGTITLAAVPRGRVFTGLDLALAQDLADRAALAIEIGRVRQEAEEAVQVRNQFLATVSHDLRSPLATIKTYAQVLERQVSRAGTVPRERVLAGLATISGTATKMANQIGELLDVARLHAGEPLVLERHPTDLVALARQVVNTYREESPRHSLRVQAVEKEIVGHWDRDRLDRVLGNLVANAIKYSPNGGEVTVTLSRQPDAGGESARLVVQDQGLGIPAADLPHIFERFHRGSNVVGRIPGTGVGLASVRQIVQQHGGLIEVLSREGEGSTVTIRLPLAPM